MKDYTGEILIDGTRRWTLDGEYHRLDGPAIIWLDGHENWYHQGKRHRVDGPAVIYDGCQIWYRDGLRHRLDGPAYYNCNDGYKEWYQDGKRHRVDGPAIIGHNKSEEWFIDDIDITDEVQGWIIENNICSWKTCTDVDKLMFRMKFQ